MYASLFISKVHTGSWLPATFLRRWWVATSRSSGGADELSNITRRVWPHRIQVAFIFFFSYRIDLVRETISPTLPARIIHFSGGCLRLIQSGVKWQAGSFCDRGTSQWHPGETMESKGLLRCKIVVVGDTQCGKTALLHVFAKDSYPEVRQLREFRRGFRVKHESNLGALDTQSAFVSDFSVSSVISWYFCLSSENKGQRTICKMVLKCEFNRANLSCVCHSRWMCASCVFTHRARQPQYCAESRGASEQHAESPATPLSVSLLSLSLLSLNPSLFCSQSG